MTDTRTATYSIPANKTYTFDKNIRKLNKKAVVARADANFTASYSDPYPRSIQIDADDGSGKPRTVKVMFVDVEVTGPDFAIGNHTLVTMADFDDVENPTFSDFVNDHGFADYNEISRECEHCNTNRPRRKMFILRNNDNGEFVQVGKSCLKDYLGHSIADALKGCSLWLGMTDFEESLYGDAIRSNADLGEPVEYIVAIAAHEIRENGYVSRAEAEEKWIKATADRVRESNYTPTEDDKAEAAAIVEWAKAEYVFDADDARKNSSFVLNISNLLDNGWVSRKMIGFAACLPAMKQRAEDRAAREALAGKSEYFGKIKQRLEAEATVTAVHYIDGYYGVTYLYMMTVDGTNVAKWFSSRDVLEVGKTYTLKMTVKDHEEFNGTKQTIVTRCAIQ